MTHFGKIESYDSIKGSGMIAPDKGGDALHFGKSDLKEQGSQPRVDQRYGYDTSQVDGGDPRAVNVHMAAGNDSGSSGDKRQDQARSQKG